MPAQRLELQRLLRSMAMPVQRPELPGKLDDGMSNASKKARVQRLLRSLTMPAQRLELPSTYLGPYGAHWAFFRSLTMPAQRTEFPGKLDDGMSNASTKARVAKVIEIIGNASAKTRVAKYIPGPIWSSLGFF